jgi:dihydrofolate reductase
MNLNIIIARSRNGVTGNNNVMPWHLPEDLAHFKRVTEGKTVIMGRKTWESLPDAFRPLPCRENIVLTNRLDWAQAGAVTANSLQHALELATRDECWVIGGASLYAQALPFATDAWVTEIDEDFEGDTHAPAMSWEWAELHRQKHTSSTGLDYNLVRLTNMNTKKLDGPDTAPGKGFSDQGPWSAGKTDGPKERVYVQSDTFKNDVRLYVDGDFWNIEGKLAYATELAGFLSRGRMPDKGLTAT